LESGDIIYVRPDFNPMGGSTQSSSIQALVAYNLTDGNLDLAYRVQNPINVTEVDIANTTQRESSNWLTFFLPYIITFLFYIVILTSSTLLLNTISNEKQNRVMEILMTSVTPRQLLTGKIIALGLVGLLQTVVWLGSGLLMLRFSGSAFALSSAFQLPVSVLAWGILFFIFGYALYASLMAGIGALVPNLREASQLTTIVILPMIIPLMFISALINTPDSPISVFFSLFPFTSPVGMMTRLSATNVPLWQTGLSILLLAATAVILVRASAGLFRAQNLLSGKSVSTRDFFKALAGK
jgi:ABC-2 type transport system permease protein